MTTAPKTRRARWDDEPQPTGLSSLLDRAILHAALRQRGVSAHRVVKLLTDFALAIENGEVVDHDTAANCLNWLAEAIVGSDCDECERPMDRPVCPTCARPRQ